MKADTDKLLELSAGMNRTQAKIQTIEVELALYIEQFPELSTSILYQDRMTLVEQILKVRDAVLPKCKGVLAINRDDLAKIAKGRVLMSGYHSRLQKKGQTIKNHEVITTMSSRAERHGKYKFPYR